MGAKDRVKMPCIGCGLCCTIVGRHFENYDKAPKYMQKALDDFPYEVREDGTCEKLGENMLCTVYDNRPIACDMEKLYSMGKKELGVPRKEYYAVLNYTGCFPLIEEKGTPEQAMELSLLQLKQKL